MPRRSSGPKLWLDKERQTWTVIDGRKSVRTGCSKANIQGAKEFLKEYLAANHSIQPGNNPLIADVLKLYAADVTQYSVAKKSISYDLEKLEAWWGEKRISEVNADNCRAYIKHRSAPTICRRELGFLNAAIVYWHKHPNYGPISVMPVVVKPPRSEPRNNFLTRSQAAQMLWAGRRKKRFVRFFLIGWYTGTRHTAILGTRWDMVDWEARIMYRRRPGVPETRKRTPPVKIADRLYAHLKRWKRLDGPKAEYIMTFGGKPTSNILTAWNTVREKTGIDVTPHVLRHSRATHLMRQRVDPWQSSKSLGMSLEVLETTYGHHHPDWQNDAAKAK